MPTPRPLTLVTAAAVEKPGRKMSCSSSRSASCAARSGSDEAALDGLLANLVDGNAGAVVGDFDDDVAALLTGAQRERTFGILAGGLAHVRRLNAVVERVADRVGERVLDGFEQALVEFGLLAFHLQAHAAAERLREIAHDARHLGEDVRDRLHARFHHGLAQVGGDHVETARKQGQAGIATVACSTWLRVSTSSPTRFIMRLSRVTSTACSVAATAEGIDGFDSSRSSTTGTAG